MIESEIRTLLQTIATHTRKSYATELRKIGLHIGQELALFYLWKEDGITQSQLRCKIGSEASTVSNMVRKLERDEIIYRVQDEYDHRISKVYLTEKGRQFKEPIGQIWRNHEQAMLKGISQEELAMMRKVLSQMDKNLFVNDKKKQ